MLLVCQGLANHIGLQIMSVSISRSSKKNMVYLISPISDDKNINSLKRIRINPNSVEFYNDPPVCEDFKDSILICDDIESYDKNNG